MWKIIDTHCHPNLNTIKDKNEIINNFFSNDWEAMITIWSEINSSKELLELANSRDNIYVAIWIHPIHTNEYNLEEAEKMLEELYINNKNKIVAIWEIWLDYYHFFKELEEKNIEEEIKRQKDFFIMQINLAKKYNLPIIIHNRESKNDIFNILQYTNFKKFVLHCYSEDLEYAQKILNFSDEAMISFSWTLTFKNAKNIQETAKNISLEKILAETDSPYLTPTPLRGKEENEPIFTKYIIEKIAELKEKEEEEVSKIILNNSKRFFNI